VCVHNSEVLETFCGKLKEHLSDEFYKLAEMCRLPDETVLHKGKQPENIQRLCEKGYRVRKSYLY